ncbi:hypothetical protein Tco_1131282, partial [Tanacetum coccineum]
RGWRRGDDGDGVEVVSWWLRWGGSRRRWTAAAAWWPAAAAGGKGGRKFGEDGGERCSGMQDMLPGVLSIVLILLGPTVTNSSSSPIECRMTVNSSPLHRSSGLSMLRRVGIGIGEYSLLITS